MLILWQVFSDIYFRTLAAPHFYTKTLKCGFYQHFCLSREGIRNPNMTTVVYYRLLCDRRKDHIRGFLLRFLKSDFLQIVAYEKNATVNLGILTNKSLSFSLIQFWLPRTRTDLQISRTAAMLSDYVGIFIRSDGLFDKYLQHWNAGEILVAGSHLPNRRNFIHFTKDSLVRKIWYGCSKNVTKN